MPGIIPADAGSTAQTITSSGLIKDHPRGCGEHHVITSCSVPLDGIIPADAGSTERRPSSPSQP